MITVRTLIHAGLVMLCLMPATAQNIRVSLLGTGTPRPMIERFSASILVEAGGQKLLFDCGRGATIRLFQLGIPLADVDQVFLTHLHSDHVIGIPDLWLTGWIFGRKTPLAIRGPAGTRSLTKNLSAAYDADVHLRRDVDEKIPGEGWKLSGDDIEEGVAYEKDGVKVTAFAVDHGPVKPAFGYRIDYRGRSVVLSGDTRPSENLVRNARGVDLLVHEVYALEIDLLQASPVERIIMDHHTSPEQAGEIFSRVKPRLALYSHIGRGSVSEATLLKRTRKTYAGPLRVGADLMAIEVGERITVLPRRPLWMNNGQAGSNPR